MKLFFLVLLLFTSCSKETYQSFKISTVKNWVLYSPQQLKQFATNQNQDIKDYVDKMLRNSNALLFMVKGGLSEEKQISNYTPSITVSEISDQNYTGLKSNELLKQIVIETASKDVIFTHFNQNDTNSFKEVYSEVNIKMPALFSKMNQKVDTLYAQIRIYQTDSLESFYLISSTMLNIEKDSLTSEIDEIYNSFKTVILQK
jgi:predicted DNA-binding helix-hairpin-helix protein